VVFPEPGKPHTIISLAPVPDPSMTELSLEERIPLIYAKGNSAGLC